VAATPTAPGPVQPALVCKVCGQAIEALVVEDGREVLDLAHFRQRHATCLNASTARPAGSR